MLGRCLVVCCAALLLAAPSALARDYSDTALNIVPSGQYQTPSPQAERQARMYDALTPLFSNVGNDDVQRLFKSERLEPDRVVSEERIPGRPGVVIRRDTYNVPHVYGETNDDVIFGAGWVLAAGQNLLINQARYNGMVAALDAPNLDAIPLITRLYQFEPSAQANAIVARQSRVLERAGTKGRQLLRDIDTYLEGINAWYRANQPSQPPLTRVDIFSLNAIKAEFLGQGGGNEPENTMFLDGLRGRFGERRGDPIFEDLRARTDPDTTTTLDESAPYEPDPPESDEGVAVLRNNSYRPVEFLPGSRAASARSQAQGEASNILMASGRRSITGKPLFVGGPQIGYFFPGLTYEVGLYGPGIETRGVTSAPFPGYMLIGRGQDYAWTLTSASADIIDTYAETLCGGSTRKYLYRGRCRDMERVDAGTLVGDGQRIPVRFDQTVHGPVVGYARTRDGNRLVAITQRRSSRGQETLDQLFFQDLTFDRVRDFDDFREAALQTPQTFNAFYADSETTGMVTTGRLPLRPDGADPSLVTDGRGAFEWRGFQPKSRHPAGTVDDGLLVNWNEKPARDFVAGDDRFGSEGPAPRVLLLRKELGRREKHTIPSMVGAMNAGATEDVRGRVFYETLDRVLRHGTSPSTLATRTRDELVRWARARAPRLDQDGDGKLDHAGVAIMDVGWKFFADAAMCPRLGKTLCDQLAGLMSRFSRPPGGQYGGWHHYMLKDFRTLLDRPVEERYSTSYCGKGSLERCADAMWRAMDRTARRLARSQGPNPSDWRQSFFVQDIRFSPLPLITMAYTNRPSGIQQVISFDRRR